MCAYSIYVQNCALLGYYSASNGNNLLMYRYNQSVLSFTLEGGTDNNL
jgi:hypothetical protein